MEHDVVTDAIRDHLNTLSQTELIAAEHRAQIRVANAGQGVMRIKERVDAGILPQSSLDAARDEDESARFSLGLVHEAQQIELGLRQAAEAGALAIECPGCEDSRATGPLCEDCR